MLRLLSEPPEEKAFSSFSQWDYSAVCGACSLALWRGLSGGPQVWGQLDNEGTLLALVLASGEGMLALSREYNRCSPILREELSCFLHSLDRPFLMEEKAARLLELPEKEGFSLFSLENPPDLPPAAPAFSHEISSGELWDFLCACFPRFASKDRDTFIYALSLGLRRDSKKLLALRDESGKLIACGGMYHRFAGTGILENIAVLPDHWGQGLGISLLGALCHELLTPVNGVSCVSRLLLACDPETSPFYEKAGFSSCGRFVRVDPASL